MLVGVPFEEGEEHGDDDEEVEHVSCDEAALNEAKGEGWEYGAYSGLPLIEANGLKEEIEGTEG